MAQRAGVPCGDDASRRALTREWYGFVHAAVVYGLMAQASNQVMAKFVLPQLVEDGAHGDRHHAGKERDPLFR